MNSEPSAYFRAKFEISTLGPSGTCSHQVAERYLRFQHLDPTAIQLTPSFEEGAASVIIGNALRLLMPAAYRKHADIIFDNAGKIKVVDAFTAPTPEFFLLMNPDIAVSKVVRVAAHASPRRLLDRVPGLQLNQLQIVDATSNANAADLLVNKKVQACLTVRSARTEAMLATGKAVQVTSLGCIMMAWSVLAAENAAMQRLCHVVSPVI